MGNAVRFDPQDWELMGQLMREYGDSDTMFWGKSETGDDFTISISRERITTATFLSDNRTRKNTYYNDGASEEFYEV